MVICDDSYHDSHVVRCNYFMYSTLVTLATTLIEAEIDRENTLCGRGPFGSGEMSLGVIWVRIDMATQCATSTRPRSLRSSRSLVRHLAELVGTVGVRITEMYR